MQEKLLAAEEALAAARAAEPTANDRAVRTIWCLEEVREALTFPVDTVNRSLFFDELLDKQGKVNRSHVIRFLLDHGRKMERTWGFMREMAEHFQEARPQPAPAKVLEQPEEQQPQPPQSGPPEPEEPAATLVPAFATPERPATTAEEGGPSEPAEEALKAPEATTPMSWSHGLPDLSMKTLMTWKSVLPAGTPLAMPTMAVRTDLTPTFVKRKVTTPAPRQDAPERTSRTGSATDLVRPLAQSPFPIQIPEAATPPTLGRVDQDIEMTQASPAEILPTGTAEAGSSPMRRSPRLSRWILVPR